MAKQGKPIKDKLEADAEWRTDTQREKGAAEQTQAGDAAVMNDSAQTAAATKAGPGRQTLFVPHRYFNAAYLPMVNCPARYHFYWGGAGSGKSAFVAARVILDAMVGRNTLVCRKTAVRIFTSCYNEIRKAAERLGVLPWFKFQKEGVTCLHSGAQILFSGLDDQEKIKSVSPQQGVLTDVWMEEATEFTFQDFRQLDKRLRGQSPFHKRMTLTFNPCDRAHWLYTRYFENKTIQKPLHRSDDVVMLHTTYLDNRFLAEDDGQALEKEGDAFHYQVYTKGEWGQRAQGILKNWTVQRLEISAFAPHTLRIGVDFGFAADPSAAIKVSVDAAGRSLFVLDELVLHGATADVLAAHLKPFAAGRPLICDSAEPRSIEDLRRFGLSARPVQKSRVSVPYAAQWLAGCRLVVNAHCVHFLRELEGWQWKENRDGTLSQTPKPGNDHLLDALRYALEEDMSPRLAQLYG